MGMVEGFFLDNVRGGEYGKGRGWGHEVGLLLAVTDSMQELDRLDV